MITKKFILENKDKWEEYKEEVNKFSNNTLRDMILKDPDTISIIDLDKLDGEDISYILARQPSLIKYFKPYLYRLNRDNIYLILMNRPGLIRDLRPYVHKIKGWHVSYIIQNSPELSLFFEYRNTQYEDAAYYCACPSEISKLDEEEKYELSKKMVELIKEEKNDY